MAGAGIGMDDVPEQGRFVPLRSAANISLGGTPLSCLSVAHPDNLELAIRAARLMRLDLAGIDLIIPDIARSWRETGGAICEVNAQPQFTVAEPGSSFNIISGLFEGDGRIPTILVLGGRKEIAAGALVDAFREQGMRLALLDGNATCVDGTALDVSGGTFEAVRALAGDPAVDAMVIRLDGDDWLTSGAPLDRFDLLLTTQSASAGMRSLLTPLCALGTRHVKPGQFAARKGAADLACEAARMRLWHDHRRLDVERVTSAALSASPYVRTAAPRSGSIGLCMIARNEAAIIRECLDSVRTLVDYVLVEDTGSSDGTQDVVRRWLADNGMPGEVIETPWRDFASNRTGALAHLRARHDLDYALVMDADDLLVMEDGFDLEAFKAGLHADLYDCEIHWGALRFRRPQLLRNARAFGYTGVLHEYVDPPADCEGRDVAGGLYIKGHSRGARSRNPRKYEEDAAVLERALAVECLPALRSRYLFYLAQSHQDGGHYRKAIDAYAERLTIDHFPDERYVTACRLAALKEKLDYPPAEVEAMFRQAIGLAPDRKEAYHGLARFMRRARRYGEAYEVAARGVAADRTKGLFIHDEIYRYAMLEEAALTAELSGNEAACASYCEALLPVADVPERVRMRILRLLNGGREDRIDASKAMHADRAKGHSRDGIAGTTV